MSIKVENLSFSYGKKKILTDISTSFVSGEISVIAGPNGSGKTTLVKSIMTLLEIDKKSVFLNNSDILSYTSIERAKNIGYVAQYSPQDFDFTVYEVVEMGRYPYKKEWNSAKDIEAISRALKLTETTQLKHRSINTLSGGELQRVLLARALAGNPKCLILDEPSSNLDISHNNEMMKLLKVLTKEFNIVTIMVLHDLNSILHYADKIIMLKEGELVIEGDVENVLQPDNIKDIYGVNSQILSDKNGSLHLALY